MGVYLNPGAALFRRGRSSRIYVDKSQLIAYLNAVVNTERAYVCVSRPRRFGKSMAANMVSAYFDRTVDGVREFEGLAISRDPSFTSNLGRFDVIKLNMQDFLSATHDITGMIERMDAAVCRELVEAYPEVRLFDPGSLAQTLSDIFAQTQSQFVIVIDEWDCVMREHQADIAGQKDYLDFLRALLKDKPYVALCYMTGILPIKKYGSHSALNMFDEFSMTEPDEMAPYMGFTEAEVRELCGQWHRDFSECSAWYDGYVLDGVGSAYNPQSVVRAMETGRFGSYWTKTETYEALRRYIDLNMGGLREKVVMLMGGRARCGGYQHVCKRHDDTELCRRRAHPARPSEDIWPTTRLAGRCLYQTARSWASMPARLRRVVGTRLLARLRLRMTFLKRCSPRTVTRLPSALRRHTRMRRA